MKKSEEPTLAQVGYIRDTAIELGLTREMFQTLRDDGTWTKVLKERRDVIIADIGNCTTFELSATVNQSRPYMEALKDASSNILSDYDVREVGSVYLPISDKEEKVDFILRNFPRGGGSWDKALKWAKSRGHKTTNPREIFAVFKQHDLCRLLERNHLLLVATEECTFDGSRQTVTIRAGHSFDKVALDGLGYFGDNDQWFLFRK